MSNQRVASRYAKSIMELSLEKGRLEEVHADFERLTALGKSNRELAVVLNNPVVKSDKKLNILKALFQKDADPITITFFEIVSRKNRENILMDVAVEFEHQYNSHKSIQVADITTTFELNDELRKEFKEVVKEISGKDSVQLREKIDPTLIGGYILKVNDRQIDESLSSKLRQLKTKFTENHYESKI